MIKKAAADPRISGYKQYETTSIAGSLCDSSIAVDKNIWMLNPRLKVSFACAGVDATVCLCLVLCLIIYKCDESVDLYRLRFRNLSFISALSA